MSRRREVRGISLGKPPSVVLLALALAGCGRELAWLESQEVELVEGESVVWSVPVDRWDQDRGDAWIMLMFEDTTVASRGATGRYRLVARAEEGDPRYLSLHDPPDQAGVGEFLNPNLDRVSGHSLGTWKGGGLPNELSFEVIETFSGLVCLDSPGGSDKAPRARLVLEGVNDSEILLVETWNEFLGQVAALGTTLLLAGGFAFLAWRARLGRGSRPQQTARG